LGKLEVEAVKGATFEIEKGEFAVISGPSGSGKSTILNMIGLIDVPTSGKLEIDGTDIYGDYLQSKAAQKAQKQGVLPKKTDNKITTLRHEKIGFIFQGFNLIPTLTALENVMLAGKYSGMKKSEKIKRANELMKLVGLEERMNHKPNELSGGQQQRVAIARSLMNEPALILADEPTGELDSNTSLEIIDILKKLNKDNKQTFLIVTHNNEVAEACNKTIKLKDGKNA
jgi:putative ABC transport system ATP-binding protein